MRGNKLILYFVHGLRFLQKLIKLRGQNKVPAPSPPAIPPGASKPPFSWFKTPEEHSVRAEHFGQIYHVCEKGPGNPIEAAINAV